MSGTETPRRSLFGSATLLVRQPVDHETASEHSSADANGLQSKVSAHTTKVR
jgi:hypothetical protein